MKPTKNPVTGDTLVTKPSTEKYDTGWDAIWGKKCECEMCGKKLYTDHIHTCTPKEIVLEPQLTIYEVKKLITKTVWHADKKEWRCKFCGQKHDRMYVATGHDHTDYEIDWCECRKQILDTEK